MSCSPHEATPPIIRLEVGVESSTGKVRQQNQDCALALSWQTFEQSFPNTRHLFAVADGMGGEAYGDKAASLAIRVMARVVLQRLLPLAGADPAEESAACNDGEIRFPWCRVLCQAIQEANRVIYDYAAQDGNRRGMGTTITTALVDGNRLCIGHVGDTRAYRFRHTGEGEPFEEVQLTEDHSVVGELVRMGQITAEEALNSPQRSMLYRALGTSAEVESSTFEQIIQPGDILVLCSDGVWENFLPGEMGKMIAGELSPQSIARSIIDICLDRGADDNCTVVVLRADRAEESWP